MLKIYCCETDVYVDSANFQKWVKWHMKEKDDKLKKIKANFLFGNKNLEITKVPVNEVSSVWAESLARGLVIIGWMIQLELLV